MADKKSAHVGKVVALVMFVAHAGTKRLQLEALKERHS